MILKKHLDIFYYFGGIVILLSLAFFFLSNPENQLSSNDNVVSTIFIAGHISEAHQLVIDNFNKNKEGQIRVESVNLSFKKFSTDEKKELFARFLRSESDKIDVFLIDQIWVPRFAKWSEPLENYFSYQERQNILTEGLEACLDDHHLVCVPLFIDIALMYYRDDLLQKYSDYNSLINKLESSITWEEFISLGMRPENRNQPFYTFQGKAYEGLMCSFIELLASQNMTLYRDNKLMLNTPEARKALKLLVDFVNTYKLSSKHVLEFEENKSYDYFIENDGVFLRGWPNLGWHFNPDSLEKIKIQHIKKTLPPHFKDQKKSSILGGWNLMISKFSKNKNASIEFIKYWLSDEAQKIMYEVGGYLPANKKLYENKKYTEKHSELIFYRELISKGFHRPFLKNYTKISGIISNYVNMAIAKKYSVDEALQAAQEKINSDPLIMR